ncbi:metallophosphoesterase [Thermotoga caldifontis]|uniref:metallophosphoesterase n=1 Tax=Thermotoga caldifontis TaxID=1508419 RepID=UPI000596E97C|nr:metallophosphoesterase [Thermotoga caldifontis]
MWLILSDTHDNLNSIERFVEEARRRNVTHVFHCGDVVSPFALNRLLKIEAEFHAVFGNNDGEVLLLAQRASGRIVKGPIELVVDGKKIVMMHEPFALEALLISQQYDFIFYGHTHKLDVRKQGRTVLVNPGDGSGYLAEKPSAVFVDPETGQVDVYRL